MDQQLNQLERALLNAIVLDNKRTYPFIEIDVKKLKVKSRENTGVGIYTNFDYSTNSKVENVNTLISSERTLNIKGFENEVTYVLDIKEGKINFLELVTNGSDEFIKDQFEFDFELN